MLGVIIGRFQTPYLIEGHRTLFDTAFRENDQVLILIGDTSAIGTDRNPLSYKVRADLLSSHILDYRKIILSIADNPSDSEWSKNVDQIIERLGFLEARIYGGRDNSIEGYYSGKHPIKIIETVGRKSATEIRKEIGKETQICEKMASGIIHHIENRYPIVYSTVDIVLRYNNCVLMGKKGNKFSFPGGFVDSQDENLHDAAFRELEEETGLKWSLHYHSSMKVEDERYKNTKDSIMTHIFTSGRSDIEPEIDYDKIADKEFKEFKLIPLKPESLDLINFSHHPIFLKFINQ